MKIAALILLSVILFCSESKLIPGFEDGNPEALKEYIEKAKNFVPKSNEKRYIEQSEHANEAEEDAAVGPKFARVNKVARALTKGDCGYQVPGISIGVTKGNDVIYKKSFGWADYAGRKRMTEDTLFVLCSNTKPFTGAYVASAINAGSITENSKIRDLLNKKWSHVDPFVDHNLNVEDGILHRVGWYRADTLYDSGQIKTDEETIQALKTWPLQYQFRSKFLYNNYAYALTGEAIAQSRGTNWISDVKNVLLTPLGMSSSTANYSEALATGKMSTYYSLNLNDGSLFAYPKDVNRVVNAVSAAASICSSVNDMTKWLRFQANGGKNTQGVQILPADVLAWSQSPKTADFIFNMESTFSPADLVLTGYAYGWNTGVYRGRDILFHNGAEAGVLTITAVIPTEKVGVVIFLNLELGYTIYSSIGLLTTTLDAALGYTPFINQTTVCTFPCPFYQGCNAAPAPPQEETPTPAPTTPLFNPPLSEYVGNYSHPSFGTFYFQSSSNGLVFNNGAGLSCYTLSQNRDTFPFHCDFTPFFTFPIDSTLYFSRDITTDVTVLNFPYYAWDGVGGTAPFTKDQ